MAARCLETPYYRARLFAAPSKYVLRYHQEKALTEDCTVIDPYAPLQCMILAGKSCAGVNAPVIRRFNFTVTHYESWHVASRDRGDLSTPFYVDA